MAVGLPVVYLTVNGLPIDQYPALLPGVFLGTRNGYQVAEGQARLNVHRGPGFVALLGAGAGPAQIAQAGAANGGASSPRLLWPRRLLWKLA
jgi:hypothetical protein